MLNRRTFLSGPLAAPVARAAASRPHIVILLADDLGWRDVGFHGGEIRTPHIDRLAREGVRFERFCAFPLCSPTRAALMTGRSPIRLGVVCHHRAVRKPWRAGRGALHGAELSLHRVRDRRLRQVHLGHTHRRFLPGSRGFEHSYGCLNGRIDYFTKDREGGYDWHRDGATVRDPGYSTDQIADEAVRLIRARDRARPLFLYVPFNAPHAPLHRPPRHWEDYAAVTDEGRRMFCAMTACMDDAIGRILAALDDARMSRDTLVLFFSDNGGPTGIGARNDPLRGGKRSTFEGGLRGPAVMRWPGILPAGGKSQQLMSMMDVFPTFCAAAGIEPRNRLPLDGRNLWPGIRAGRTEPREDLFFGSSTGAAFHYAVYHGDWKLVRILSRKGEPPLNHLFRPAEDPREEEDLVAVHPDLVKDLAARIDAWRALYPADGIVEPKKAAPPGKAAPRQWAEAVLP